jgi:tRNA (cytidine/uridine-2'-O-)-methyltransferase
MFHVVLFEPEIPANTGNIIRLCANSGATLHLIRPLGFFMDDRRLRRAGLDYHEWADVLVHNRYDEFLAAVEPARAFAFSSHAHRIYSEAGFARGDALVFGPETRGLPPDTLARFAPEHRLRIPMCRSGRSINLANSVAVVVFEAWRQLGYGGAQPPPGA